MPNLAAAIFGKIFCHEAEVHSSWQEGGDQVRGRPTQGGDTTMKLQKNGEFVLFKAILACFRPDSRESLNLIHREGSILMTITT
jgi:hypothetical protein